MARVRLASILLVGLTVAPLGVAEQVEVPGVLRANADITPMRDCTVGVDDEVCAVSWETNGTLLPGDDEIRTDKHINDVVVQFELLSLPGDVAVEPSEVHVNHTAFHTLNQTWDFANRSLPAAVREYVTLDSRAWEYDGTSWGLFVTPHPPTSIPYVADVGFCWDVCYVYNNPLFTSNDGGIQLFPYNIFTGTGDTDRFLDYNVDGATECQGPTSDPSLCSALTLLRTSLHPIAGSVEATLPNVVLGFSLNRTVVEGAHGAGPVDQGSIPRLGSTNLASQGAPDPRSEGNPVGHMFQDDPLSWKAPPGGVLAPSGEPVTGQALAVEVPKVVADLFGEVIGAMAIVLAAWLYSRISRERVLVQPTRRAIYDLIVERPGLRVGAISSQLGVSYKTVLHHVDYLRMHGLVTSMGIGQQRYFAADACPPSVQAAIAISNPTCSKMLAAMHGRGWVGLIQLCEELGLSKSTASEAANMLVAAGLAARCRERRRLMLSAREPV